MPSVPSQIALQPLDHDQRMKRDDTVGLEGREKVIIYPAHDCDKPIVTVLALNLRGQQVFNVLVISAESVE